ncbi:MAG: hypothetical protein J7L41_06140 [Synergistetes bacterium]|nr:hypothetical protein [Synergistota bacterium]
MEGLNLKVGMTGSAQMQVTEEYLATKFVTKSVHSLGTPMLINLMSVAAYNAVKDYLPEGYITVSTMVNIRHLSATPLGMMVTARAELTAVEGLKLTFKVEAYDEIEKVGEGVVERFVVNVDKFNKKIEERKRI